MAKRIEGSMLLLLSVEEGQIVRKIVAVPHGQRSGNRKTLALTGALLLVCLLGLVLLGLLEPEEAMFLIKHLASLLLV